MSRIMLRELKTFLAVVRHGSFARAGAQLGLTQSAVSAQIQRLEDDLGFTLFDRTGRSAALNPAGQRTVEVAQELLAVYARLAVAIKPPFALPPELKWSLLVREPFVLAVPRRLAKEPWRTLLSREPLIRYDRNSFGGRLVDRFLKRMRINVDDVVELDELPAIIGLVAAGVGVAIVPRAATLHFPPAVRTVGLDSDTFYREVGIVERASADQQGASCQFATGLRATVSSMRS
jgi:DNA-binding transcriptional LysR family regulator